jgi:hypothetical protein
MIELDKSGWPIEMPIPLPQHWCTRHFIDNDGRGCLGGWIEHVFTGGKDPYDADWMAHKNPPPAARKFSKRVVELLGLPKKWRPQDFDKAWDSRKIDGKKCTQAWEKTAEEFGYTEDV